MCVLCHPATCLAKNVWWEFSSHICASSDCAFLSSVFCSRFYLLGSGLNIYFLCLFSACPITLIAPLLIAFISPFQFTTEWCRLLQYNRVKQINFFLFAWILFPSLHLSTAKSVLFPFFYFIFVL